MRKGCQLLVRKKIKLGRKKIKLGRKKIDRVGKK